MEWLISFVESPCCSNLLFALLHSLWQGALIAALLYLFFRAKVTKGENARYKAGLIAMAAVVLCALFTFSILNFQFDPATKTTALSGAKQQGNTTTVERLKNNVLPESIEVQSVSEKPFSTSTSSIEKADLNWKPLVLALWFAGVVIMLLRAMHLIAGGAKLRSECNELKDDRILAIVESLRERMKITRKIRVAVSDQISIPGVIGFFRSVLFLPASMLSGMPADALEAILAHELAHIKRYDYLVNFCQMVVEAILFFNPAVWWISRQIRIEREVCCDNAGIAAIGRRIRYAEVLVGWAEKLRHPDMELSTAAMGLGSPDTCGPMAERIKRIVTTDHKPSLKAPWHIAGMTLLLSFIVIGCLWMGADVTVAVAGKMLSIKDRVDRITEISQDYGYHAYDYGEDDKIRVSGTIKTWDGKPLPERPNILLDVKNGQGTMSYVLQISTDGPLAATGTFNQEIDCGPFYVFIRTDGYAPIKEGPFIPDPGVNIEGLEYVLQKGYPATIKVVDDNNEPVEKVKITGSYKITDTSWIGSLGPLSDGLITDANGIATIDNMTSLETSLTSDADGFEPYYAKDFIFKSDVINVIQLTSSKETNGIVVSKATGEPVEGAKLMLKDACLIQDNSSGGGFVNNLSDSEPETVTDENGRFRLRKLHSDYEYVVVVEAEGYRRHYLTDVLAGTENIMVELGPEKSIKGKITGDLEKLKKDENDTPFVIYSELHKFEHGVSLYAPKKANVIIENGIGYFEVEKCPWQGVEISAGGKIISVDVDKDDLDNVLIDLGPKVTRTREVVLKFNVPENGTDIEGKVRINYISRDNAQMWGDTVQEEIIDNQAQLDIPASVFGKISFFINMDNGNRPSGYWFDDNISVDIPDGNEPYIIEIPVYPAGAVYGTIRRPDGTIVDDAHISVKVIENSEAAKQGYTGSINSSVIHQGTFNVTPIPLDGEYGIIAYDGNSYGVSELIEINKKNPVANIDIDVPEGVDIHGRLVDVDGNSAKAPVQIAIIIKRGKISHRYFGSEIWSDEDGRFVFENVNPGPYGKCLICAGGEKGYQNTLHEIKDLSEPILIQLKKGLRATGVLINEDTGLPVSGAKIRAIREVNNNGKELYERVEAEEATNENGEFVFTSMSDGKYKLHICQVDSSIGCDCNLTYEKTEITGGQEAPVVFKVGIANRNDSEAWQLN